MTSIELRTALERRRQELGMSYRDIQRRTTLGYNTVRRAFTNPFTVHFKNILMICETMACTLLFSIENQMPDEIESGTQPPAEMVMKELKQRDASDEMAK